MNANQKIEDNVNFPIESLKMHKFVNSQGEQLYDLVGVIRHYGRLNNGHYRAVAKNSESGSWYNFDDE